MLAISISGVKAISAAGQKPVGGPLSQRQIAGIAASSVQVRVETVGGSSALPFVPEPASRVLADSAEVFIAAC